MILYIITIIAHRHAHTHVYVYMQHVSTIYQGYLALILCMHVCTGVTIWDWADYVGAYPFRKLILLLSAVIEHHRLSSGLGWYGISPLFILAYQLVLSLCWSCFGNQSTVISRVPFSVNVYGILSNNRHHGILVLKIFLLLPFLQHSSSLRCRVCIAKVSVRVSHP